MIYDCVIIGRGPAGLSAAIYLARANKKVLVIGKENKIWKNEVNINNYFGIGEITGKLLMEKGEAQAKSFGTEILNSLVTKISVDEKGLFNCLANSKEFTSKKLLIATGSSAAKKEIINQEDFIGRGVSFCVPCDGFFFKNKKVIVIGNGEYALEEAIELLNYTNDVTLVSNGKKLSFDKKLLDDKEIKFEEFIIEKIIGEKKVEGIKTNKEELKIDGIFIASGNADSNDLARMLGLLVENNKIIVNSEMKTNLSGVFAAGDCTPGFGQIATAVAKGAVAGLTISKEI
ncbi:MAG: FAD-dependent oxidoreductase [Candidatus Nanoarchaeia archaeon]|nr:FAD-dependent oxidoreductase [Candidatus Nanoarchaeia archaeon]